jgi:hypothetical protein
MKGIGGAPVSRSVTPPTFSVISTGDPAAVKVGMAVHRRKKTNNPAAEAVVATVLL